MPAFRLFYDGACPICRREALWLKRRDRQSRLELEDISAPDFDANRHGLSAIAVRQVLHGILPDGRVVSRVEALCQAYRAVGLGWAVWPLSVPGLRWIAERMYSLFARNRHRLGRWLGGCGDRCATGQ